MSPDSVHPLLWDWTGGADDMAHWASVLWGLLGSHLTHQ